MITNEYNAESLVEELITIFVNHSNSVNNVNCTRSDVLVLDSSNAIKNYFHLIFKSVVFANNRCCLQFIQNVLKSLSPVQKKKIAYVDVHGNSNLIIDLSVYGRNQNFRIISSSKFGKNTPLKLVSSNENADNKLTFFESLVSDRTLVVNTMSIENEQVKNGNVPALKSIDPSSRTSEFCELDKLVQKQIGPGSILKTRIYENVNTSKSMILYNVKGFRYCDNIKRAHVSNSIYFIADVFKNCIYQKCYDCVGFRGKDIFVVDN